MCVGKPEKATLRIIVCKCEKSGNNHTGIKVLYLFTILLSSGIKQQACSNYYYATY